MIIELADKEFYLLAYLVYIGNCVVNSWRVNADKIKPYSEMSKQVLDLLVSEKLKNAQEGETERAIQMNTDEELFQRLNHFIKSHSDRVILYRFAEILAEYQYGNDHEKELSEVKDNYIEEIDRNFLKNVNIKVQTKEIFD